jgi:hypothetical protein
VNNYCIGVDPGKIVGIAIYDPGLDDKPLGGQMPYDQFGLWLESWLVSGVVGLVAVERFTITRSTALKSSDAHWAMELIGVTKFLCGKYSVQLREQQATTAKNFSTDVRLKEVGWWLPGKDHARDAVRHVILALEEERCIHPPWIVG